MQEFDTQKVQHKLDVFNQAYHQLELLLQYSYDELNENLQWGSVKWYLYVTIQCLLDACAQLAVAFGETPSSYPEIVKAITKHKLIENDLGASFESLASFRNVLAHSYINLDEEYIYHNLMNERNELIAIASAIQRFLDKRKNIEKES